MKCYECGGTYIRKYGRLEINDRYVGSLVIEPVEYSRCNRCGDYLFSTEASQQIEKTRERVLQNILESKPLGAFLSAAQTSAILAISRQALHKHRRIRRGFIFQTRFDNKTVYLKKSVQLFKATGDGRFPLRKPAKQIQYTMKTETMLPNQPYLSKVKESNPKEST
jgi:hypothetical protein